MKVRKPAVAGLFYEGDKEGLARQVEACFKHPLGPGKVPEVLGSFSGSILGIVSPHAGYMYSGPVAAHGYYELAKAGRPDIVFILGPNHHAIGATIAVPESEYWETPLGRVQVSLDLARELVKISGIAAPDDAAHAHEHSLEVQLPFLQYLFGDGFRIVPVVMTVQIPDVSRSLGVAIARIIQEHDLNAYVIASSDFTHYEDARVAERKDRMAISRILSLDYKGLYDVVEEEYITMCGPGPVMVLIVAAKELGFTDVRLLKYATSGDVTGDYSSVVGYASIAFYRA